MRGSFRVQFNQGESIESMRFTEVTQFKVV